MAGLTRRELLCGAGAAGGLAALSAMTPGFAKAATRPVGASDKLTVACIGVGSQGTRVLLDMLRLPEVKVVAVCDVNRGSGDYLDWGPDELRGKISQVLQQPSWGKNYKGAPGGRDVAKAIVNTFYAKAAGKADYDGCHAYEDYRELLAKEKDLDAVIVSTPDHWHAIIAIAAMRAGKHVYSQKPMAHSVWEAAQMARVAKETGRATQVSIFNSQTPASLRVIEMVQGGAIGPVHRVDIWTRRASAFWKQGLATPTVADPIPDGFNWEMWLGPAPMRPYNHVYLPFVWRAWYDYGCGAIGDMGEYGLDTISRALNLASAERVDASSTELFPDCYPVASTLNYHYAARGDKPAVELHWYDGGIKPQRPAELADDAPLSIDNEGVIYTGTKGKLLTGFMAESPRLLSPDGKLTAEPKVAMAAEPMDAARPELGPGAVSASRAHYMEWIGACRGGAPASANYAFEAPIVQSLMMGNIAIRTQELIAWDGEGALSRGSDRAKSLLKPVYRQPFSAD